MALASVGEISDADYLKTTVGTKAIDLEAPILALTSVGKDPRTFPDENLIAKLKSFHKDGQIGDPLALNDDIFGILALTSAGESADDQIVEASKKFILDHQNTDGGWSYALGAASDTNTTAAAIMALLETGAQKTDPAVAKAVVFIMAAQNPDGGFPYDPKSQWGTASDASSDAWVISAINKLEENPADTVWTKNGKNPRDHLLSLQKASGFFEYQQEGGEDSFTPVATSYAVIALSGKYYPVKKIVSSPAPAVSYRIEGKTGQICAGAVSIFNPLNLVKIAAPECGFTYHIKDTNFGQYLDQIGEDQAAGMNGWIYKINAASPDVGAADYVLKDGDGVLWYYGDFNWKVTRLNLDKTEIGTGESAKVTVESYAGNNWTALEGATVHAGSNTYQTDAAGAATINPSDGAYQIFAEKDGYVRSEKKQLTAGQKFQTQLELNVTLGEADNNVSGGGGGQSNNSVSFSVDVKGKASGNNSSSLGFGKITSGSASAQSVALKNPGQTGIYIESVINGDEVFKNYIKIDDKPWRRFSASLNAGEEKETVVKLAVPAGYGKNGVKTGTLLFWGVPVK